MSRRALVSAVASVLVAAAVAVFATDRTPAGGSLGVATVVRVVDGDTIIARLASGREERVRLIGIDTPESVKPDTPVQCYAEEASAFTSRLLSGRRVRLVTDVEERDRYGRLLAYVYREPDGLFVNEELVRTGYARQVTFPPNVRFVDEIRSLADAARKASRGLWSVC